MAKTPHDIIDGWTDHPDEVFVDLAAYGYAIVPREPTEKMLNAARDWSIKKNGMGVGNDQAIGCWQAMLSAALKTR